jgi:predicted ferric reductase
MKNVQKIFWSALYFLSPLIPLYVYFAGNWESVLHIWSLGMIFGIMGYIYFLNQFILSSRIKYFDRLFGQDKILRFHGYMALFAIVAIIIHRNLKYIYIFEENLQVHLGKLTAGIFLFVIIVTLLFMVKNRWNNLKFLEGLRRFLSRKLGLDYGVYRFIHNITIIGLFTVLLHSQLSSSTSVNYLIRSVMGAWFLTALICYVNHKLIKPNLLRRKSYTVRDVEILKPGVVRVTLKPEASCHFPYNPGQFAYFRFQGSLPGREEHPFTISSSPDDSDLAVTVKNVGDWTGRLAGAKKDDKVFVDGPYGLFTPQQNERHKVFIAGGIGITPFLSMLKSRRVLAGDYKKLLYWRARDRADLFADKELKEIETATESFIYNPVVSNELPDDADKGAAIHKWIEKTIDEYGADNLEFFICGPLPMNETVRKIRISLKIKRRYIHIEKFSM